MSRFLEQLFYNRKEYKFRGAPICECKSQAKDVLALNFAFIFEVNNQVKIEFNYQSDEIY